MSLLDGKIALVTGGASGIGAATVRRFVTEGARVVVADIDESHGEALARTLGDAARFVRCDHTVRAECEAAVGAAVQAWGRLDVLFNNAGIGWTGPFASCADETLQRLIAVNLVGPWQMTQAALPRLLESARVSPAGAVLLFNSSGLGLHSSPQTSAYSMIKHGVVGLMRSLAEEFGPQNLRVNALCPGMVDTPMLGASAGAWGTPQQALEKIRANLPLRRNPTADDIAAAAAFLCSDQAASIHAVALPVDGGGHG